MGISDAKRDVKVRVFVQKNVGSSLAKLQQTNRLSETRRNGVIGGVVLSVVSIAGVLAGSDEAGSTGIIVAPVSPDKTHQRYVRTYLRR
jgi:hypothetical protein